MLALGPVDFSLVAIAVQVGLNVGVLNLAYSHIIAAEMQKQAEQGGDKSPVVVKLPRILWEKLFTALTMVMVLAVLPTDEDMQSTIELVGRIEQIDGPFGETDSKGVTTIKFPGHKPPPKKD